MPKKANNMPDQVHLNGILLPWDHGDSDWVTVEVPESQAEQYESEGWVELSGASETDHVCMTRPLPFRDGTVQIKPQLDRKGRIFAGRGNTNLGYSGYFVLYVYVGGKRRTIVNYREFFPDEENAYARQQDKPEAEERIRKIIEANKGRTLMKKRTIQDFLDKTGVTVEITKLPPDEPLEDAEFISLVLRYRGKDAGAIMHNEQEFKTPADRAVFSSTGTGAG